MSPASQIHPEAETAMTTSTTQTGIHGPVASRTSSGTMAHAASHGPPRQRSTTSISSSSAPAG